MLKTTDLLLRAKKGDYMWEKTVEIDYALVGKDCEEELVVVVLVEDCMKLDELVEE